jgi:hypothetical protein
MSTGIILVNNNKIENIPMKITFLRVLHQAYISVGRLKDIVKKDKYTDIGEKDNERILSLFKNDTYGKGLKNAYLKPDIDGYISGFVEQSFPNFSKLILERAGFVK